MDQTTPTAVLGRVCWKCGNPARNRSGRPVCDGCAQKVPDRGDWDGRVRLCHTCEVQPAMNLSGPPVCQSCQTHPTRYEAKQRLCIHCGSDNVRTRGGRPVCVECAIQGKPHSPKLPAEQKERICSKCGVRPAVNHKGTPRCSECYGGQYRDTRSRKEVICTSCGRVYYTGSGNRVCSSCLHQAQRHPCAQCGEPCDKRATICLACSAAAAPSGSRNVQWKGGIITNRVNGYRLVKAPWHPRAATNKNHYVSEHVLVMEKALGRYLLPGENVHQSERSEGRQPTREFGTLGQVATVGPAGRGSGGLGQGNPCEVRGLSPEACTGYRGPLWLRLHMRKRPDSGLRGW